MLKIKSFQFQYYLLKVTSMGQKSLKTDNYDTTVAACSKVLRAYFFVRENLLDRTYKPETSKSAIVHIRTVRCICFDLEIIKKKGKTPKQFTKFNSTRR